MSTVEMEVFSDTQLIILTILMFVGGEVFISTVGLYLRRFSLKKDGKNNSSVNVELHIPSNFQVTQYDFESLKSNVFCFNKDNEELKYKSIKILGVVSLCYLVLVQFFGVVLVLIYINVISSAKDILHHKGLKALTFSIFTIVSTFTNCGFVPTNENMVVFRQNSGLLLILIPQVLLGNTLYPPFLRFCIWAIGKFTKKSETNFLLKNSKEIGYPHLLSHLHSLFLLATVFVFIVVQFMLFSTMEWNSGSLSGLNSYQKLVGGLFQTVNARHTGESIVDISTIAVAVLVLFVVMMYLPPYTSYLPTTKEESYEEGEKSRKVIEKLMFSQLSYLVVFIIAVCITERDNIKEDPLNFNVFNIVVEVISAYGNVGFSTGYNCDRRLNKDGICEPKWYGFSGKWTQQGKIILIAVMFFGRLKKFSMNGGKAWKLF